MNPNASTTARVIGAHVHISGIPDVTLEESGLFLRAGTSWVVISGATPAELRHMAHNIIDALDVAEEKA